MENIPFFFLLFSTDPCFIEKAVQAGVQSILVDCETLGKKERQICADTEVNTYTFQDLFRVRKQSSAHLICRINQVHAGTPWEIAQALDAGADEILIPMVKTVNEVEFVIKSVREKIDVGILVETLEAIEIRHELAKLALSRVYVGLNDLAIARRTQNIFLPLIDGTLEKIRSAFIDTPFGFGGLTLPNCGRPIPCHLLMDEMARLGCQFSFLRRSFYADSRGKKLKMVVGAMQDGIKKAFLRRPAFGVGQQRELTEKILAWNPLQEAGPS